MDIQVPAVWYVVTAIWFLLLLFIDLYTNKDKSQAISLPRAIKRSLIWISLGVLLGLVIWLNFGHDAGIKYFSGFLIEKSLSVDNIFVWGLILSYLNIPDKYQYKVLFWGIFGAIVFRAIFVYAGIVVIEEFSPALFILGLVLLSSAYKLLRGGRGVAFDPSESKIVKYTEKFLPVDTKYSGDRLLFRRNGKLTVSMLFVAICVIELTDIVFAVDSVPAVLAVVRDPYIVLASNIAAILGLRSLYFVLNALKSRFWLLNKGLSLILGYIGVSLILSPDDILGINWFGLELPTALSLGFVILVLAGSIIGSLLIHNKHAAED